MGKILLGHAIAEELRAAIGRDIAALRSEYDAPPKLALLTADSGDAIKQSELLVHEAVARDLGIEVRTTVLEADARDQDLIRAIYAENDDPGVHGVLVMLPFPPHMDQDAVFAAIAPEKELEGLVVSADGEEEGETTSPFDFDDVQAIMSKKRSSTIRAVRLLLDSIDFDVQRSRNVFITEDEIRDNPIVARLLQISSSVNVSVAVATTADPNIRAVTRNADLVMVSVSSPEVVDDTYLKKGAVVIDFNPIMVGQKYSEKKRRIVPILKSGVNVEAALGKAAYVAPGVGGLGPVTVASMMLNFLLNYRNILASQVAA